MRALHATAVGAEAARRLGGGVRSGRVHSAFARTVNVTLDGLGDAGWLSLHGPGRLPAPFGIACPGPLPVPALAPGAPVRVERDGLVLDGAIHLRLAGVPARDTALPTTAPRPPSAACLRAAGPDGLGPAAAAVLRETGLPADPLGRLAAPALAALHAGTAGGDAAGALAAATALLGLGPGLTPSGDDCLVGWLAGLWVGGVAGRDLLAATAPALLAAARERTGALGRAFLAAAAVGQAAEPVRDFVMTPSPAHLAGLLALGATSGGDLLAGYCLAREALAPSGQGPTALPVPPSPRWVGEGG
jgi:Protein of unknown function (DUF2877)